MTCRLAPVAVRLSLLMAAAATAACAARAFVRPVGPGEPAPDVAAAWDAARAACASVETVAGPLALSGRIGARRILGLASTTLDVAIDRAARLALEARVAGQVLFRLGGTVDRATLWMREDNRVATGTAVELLDGLMGAGVTPGRLREILAGCPATSVVPDGGQRHGRVVEASFDRVTVWLEPKGSTWTVRAWAFDDWEVTYDWYVRGAPERVTIESRAGVIPAVSLTLALARLDRNVDIPAEAFTVVVPEGARPMTLDELRASGPAARP